MRRSNTQPLSLLVQEFLNSIDRFNLRKEAILINAWPEVVGLAVAKRTEKLYIKNRVLFVIMNSSVARSELHMIREGLIKALNEHVGKKIIDDIVIR